MLKSATKAVCALCYILTGAVLVWAISLAAQGEGLACVILAAFCGVLIRYAQDEKKTAHVGGMEVRKMDDLDRKLAVMSESEAMEVVKKLMHDMRTTTYGGEDDLVYRAKMNAFLRIVYCPRWMPTIETDKKTASDVTASKAARSVKPITNTPSLSKV